MAFEWNHLLPLSAKDAKATLKQGLEVLALYSQSGKTHTVRTKVGIAVHALLGCCFGVSEHKFRMANTTYRTSYQFYDKTGEEEFTDWKLTLSDAWSKDPCESSIHCIENLSAFAKEKNIPDGEYWVELWQHGVYLDQEWVNCYDEGIVKIQNGEAVDAPFGFTAPF